MSEPIWQKSVAVQNLIHDMEILTKSMTIDELREAVLALTEQIAPEKNREEIEAWHIGVLMAIRSKT